VSKKITPSEYEILKREWDRRLKEDGLGYIEDIENTNEDPYIIQVYKKLAPLQRVAQEEYFILVNMKVMNPNTEYKRPIDKLIMQWYADGVKIKTMVEKLAELGMPRERKTIRYIIRRYIMAWRIRYFTRAQLNLKEKND